MGQEPTSSRRKVSRANTEQMMGDLVCLRIRKVYCKEFNISLTAFGGNGKIYIYISLKQHRLMNKNKPRDKEPWVRLLDLRGRVGIKGRDQPKDLCVYI